MDHSTHSTHSTQTREQDEQSRRSNRPPIISSFASYSSECKADARTAARLYKIGRWSIDGTSQNPAIARQPSSPSLPGAQRMHCTRLRASVSSEDFSSRQRCPDSANWLDGPCARARAANLQTLGLSLHREQALGVSACSILHFTYLASSGKKVLEIHLLLGNQRSRPRRTP